MFWKRRDEELLAQYKALISDLRDTIADRDRIIGELQDRLLQLALERRAPAPPVTPARAPRVRDEPGIPSRVHYPGYEPDMRPPARPSARAPKTEKPLNALEEAAVVSKGLTSG